MIVKTYLLTILILFIHQQETSCFINNFQPLLSITYDTTSKLFLKLKSSFYHNDQCLIDDIKKNITELELMINKNLYGQHIAGSYVLAAIGSHLIDKNPSKPLTMIFHGKTGTGKNYLATMIANAYFKNGEDSKYYHFINSRSDFPLDGSIDEYKKLLYDMVIENLKTCPESIFVFDEVDMMQPGVLDVLVPFLNYKRNKKIHHNGYFIDIITNRAIYIFLTNTGSQEIIDTMIMLNNNGKKRNDMVLSDFEHLISLGAFNEKGGFYKSDAISANLIDHYVPFLQLEYEHIKLCIEYAFNSRDAVANDESIQDVMAYVTFEEPPYHRFSKSGCKRIEQKTATILYKNRSKDET
ncbi:hypothetical protein HCN44_009121 [Aphidius gifuensis]|uniref:AAA+ ATPase domain-containing protein n=1 Tax=Aphidius gifuensis TaxID=684658 RepID=A0A834Y1X0_APHGI|nr:torsin-1A-like [Aphidius gifuensis]KAF7997723.1 hypothetical protein HCN44_009121 [Aphidius gifuensis]